MLQRGQDMALIAEIAVALESADSGYAEARHQVRILAVRFFHPAPARFTGDVDHRRECVVRAAQASFESRHREERLDQLGIKGRAQRDGLRKTRAFRGCVAVQALLMEHNRNAEARVLEKKSLDGVGQLRHASRRLPAAGVTGAANLSDTAAIAESFLRFRLVEVAFLVHQLLRLLLPDAEHLRSFLFERHAGKQIFHAACRGQVRILIG